MHLLQQHEYELARPLFDGMDHHLAIEAILNGSVPGAVYLDDRRNPRTAAAWFNHRFHLAAAPGWDVDTFMLHDFFFDDILPASQQKGIEGFLIFPSDGDWKNRIAEDIFPGKKIYPGKREYYEAALGEADWAKYLSPEFSLCEVDYRLLEDPSIENLDWLLEEMVSERESVEAFLEKSFGIALLYHEMIVTWCLSEYNCGDRCEAGIATAEGYQRRGLATVAGSSFLEQAKARGYNRVGWHCWKQNIPSGKTALRIGYQKVRDYSTYYVPVRD